MHRTRKPIQIPIDATKVVVANYTEGKCKDLYKWQAFASLGIPTLAKFLKCGDAKNAIGSQGPLTADWTASVAQEE
jgi:hypothetical protein